MKNTNVPRQQKKVAKIMLILSRFQLKHIQELARIFFKHFFVKVSKIVSNLL